MKRKNTARQAEIAKAATSGPTPATQARKGSLLTPGKPAAPTEAIAPKRAP